MREKECLSGRVNRRGFTLMELVVVLIILGLLVGIVGPQIYKRIFQGQVLTAKMQIQEFGNAILSYKMDTGRFPASTEGLNALVENPDGSDLWAGPYLSKGKVPKDPWNREYVYAYPGNHGNEFDLFSKGDDGQEGTADDITNW